MIQPVRIQRKRTKGFNLQEHSKSINGLECVVISRPSAFGNPFKIIGDMVFVDAGHRRKILNKWVCFYDYGGNTNEDVVKLFRDMLIDLDSHKVEAEVRNKFRYMRSWIRDLKGKNLACFCPVGNCCHGDVLLELANCDDIIFKLLMNL